MEEIFVSQYKEIRNKLRPFDLIFFKGTNFMDKYNSKSNKFSHVGLIVTADILEHPNIKKGKVYLWDATSVSHIDMNNVDNKPFIGTQLRDLDELIPKYLNIKDVKIAVAPLLNNHNYKDRKDEFTQIFRKYNNIPYHTDEKSIIDQICPCLRKMPLIQNFIPSNLRCISCSELVAIVYRELHIFPIDVKPKDILPMDFLGTESKKIPVVNYIPVMYIKI